MGTICTKCKKFTKKIFFEQNKKNIILSGYDVLESSENIKCDSNKNIINLFPQNNEINERIIKNDNLKVEKEEQDLELNEEEKLIEKKEEELFENRDNIIEDKEEKKEENNDKEKNEKEKENIIEKKKKEKNEEIEEKDIQKELDIKNEKENNEDKKIEKEMQKDNIENIEILEIKKMEKEKKETYKEKEIEKQKIEEKNDLPENEIENKENIKKNEIIEIQDDKNKEEEKVKEIIKEEKKKMPYAIILKDFLDENIDDTNVFNENWYNDFEKNKIIYSKRTIIALIKEAFTDKNNEFENLYDDNESLQISVKSTGSMINDQFQVVRSVYKINKDVYPPKTTIRMIFRYLNFIKERSSWDSQLKLYKILEGSEDGKEVKCIVHNWLKSPMFFVSERDIIDKRYEFLYNGKIYSFESSVNDTLYPPQESVTRMYDYMSIEELYEENNYIYLKAITQMDTKVSLPQSVVNATLPTKLSDFYKNLNNAINSDYEKGELIFEDWVN